MNQDNGNTPELDERPTSSEFFEYLVRLALEAFDRTFSSPAMAMLNRTIRPRFEAEVRERMAQAALCYEFDTRLEPVVRK